MDNLRPTRIAGTRRSRRLARSCYTCRNTRPISIRSRCPSASSRRICARLPSEPAHLSAAELASSPRLSAENAALLRPCRICFYMIGIRSSLPMENRSMEPGHREASRCAGRRGLAQKMDCRRTIRLEFVAIAALVGDCERNAGDRRCFRPPRHDPHPAQGLAANASS